jgi:hypothetical protein
MDLPSVGTVLVAATLLSVYGFYPVPRFRPGPWVGATGAGVAGSLKIERSDQSE